MVVGNDRESAMENLKECLEYLHTFDLIFFYKRCRILRILLGELTLDKLTLVDYFISLIFKQKD